MNLKNIMQKLSPRYKNLIIVIFFIGISLIVLFPFLFQENFMVSSDSDAMYYYYPAFNFYSNALKNGESFLWNPLLFSGFPTYLSQSGGFLDPLNILIFKFLPAIFGYNFRLLIDFILVMIFSYLAARSFGISKLASSLVGMGYLTAFHWRFLTNILIANSLFLLPFLFFIFNKALEDKKNKWFWAILGGIGIGWVFLSGYAQFIVYSIFLLGLYGVIYIFWIERGKKNLYKWLTLVSIFAILILVGFIVGAPQIVSSSKFTPLTQRADGLDYSLTTYKVVDPGDMILFLFPDYLHFPYISSGRKSLYVGPFLFFLFIVGLIIAITNRKKTDNNTDNTKRILVLGLIFLFALLASFRWSPIFYLMNKFPIFEYFRFPYRWMYLGSWFLAIIGAWGFDFIRNFVNDQKIKKVFKILSIGVVALISGILSLNFFNSAFWGRVAIISDLVFSKILYGNFGFDKDPRHYFEAIQRGISAWQDFMYLGRVELLIPFLILIFALILCMAYFWERISWKTFRLLGFSLSILTFVGIFIVQWSSSILVSSAVKSQNSFLENYFPAEDKIYYRTYPFMLDDGLRKLIPPKYALTLEENIIRTELQLATGWPNMNFYSGVQSVDGYDPFVTTNLLSALKTVASTHGGGEAENLTPEERVSRLLNHLDVIGMMSGKYIISGIELMHPDLKFLVEQKVSQYKIPIFIYENKRVISKFYFAKEIISVPGKSLQDLIQSNQRNFSKFSYLDCNDCLEHSIGGDAKIQKLVYKNGFIQLNTKSNKGKWLIISESYLPGWSATIDKKTVPLIKANGLYMALYIPIGDHEVILNYDGILGEGKLLQYLNIIK